MPSALFFCVGYLKNNFHFYSFLDNRKGSEFLKPLKTDFLEVLLFEKKKKILVLAGAFFLSCNNLQALHGFWYAACCLCAACLQGNFWSELGKNTENQTVFATS